MNNLTDPFKVERFTRALVAVDEEFRRSEGKWGVGRLERLISHGTLAAYRRGWDRYREILNAGDVDGLEEHAPKMVAALRYMDAEAERAGHGPLAPEAWEAPLADGSVLVVVRTTAEAHAVLAASEGRLPPDLAVTIRNQHEGRRLSVWTLAEIARLIDAHGSVAAVKDAFPGARIGGVAYAGTPAPSGVQRDEMAAHDHARRGYPLDEALT